MDYQYLEINPYKAEAADAQNNKVSLPLNKKRARYPEFVAASPRGLVPALEIETGPGERETAADSMVVLEFINDKFASGSSALYPLDPATRARVRFWAVFANDQIIPYYYKMLMATDGRSRQQAQDRILSGLREWARAMDPEGPYFLGEQFSIADIVLIPHVQRLLSVASHYRGFELPQSSSGEYERLDRWWRACQKRSSVASTVVDRERLIHSYRGYTNNSAHNDASSKYRSHQTSGKPVDLERLFNDPEYLATVIEAVSEAMSKSEKDSGKDHMSIHMSEHLAEHAKKTRRGGR